MHRRTLSLFVLLSCVSVLLHAQLKNPKAGVVRYSDGTLHAVYGLPANYVVDTHTLASADAASFSDAGGITSKNGHILLVNASFATVADYQSGESAPVLNIDGDLKSAVAWLSAQHALLRWSGSSFILTEVNGSGAFGPVTSLHLTPANTAKLLFTNSNNSSVSEATVALDSGEVTSVETLSGIRGPAFQQQSFVVFHDERGLAIATSTAIIQTFPFSVALDDDVTFERMSSDALHVTSRATGQNWILHLGASVTPHLSQLPSAAPSRTLPSPEAAQ